MTQIDRERLPAHLARVADRLISVGPEASGDSFLLMSYLHEVAIKTIALALYAGLRTASKENAYSIGYDLVRANGLGTWQNAISQMSAQALADYLHPDFRPTLTWLTKRRTKPDDPEFYKAMRNASAVRRIIGSDMPEEDQRRTVTHLLTTLVEIRNKTKAHGAVGPDFFAEANHPYLKAITWLLSDCPLFKCDWLHLSVRMTNNTVRGMRLVGQAHYLKDSECELYSPSGDGVHFVLGHSKRAYWIGDLLRSNREGTQFHLPNGNYTGLGKAEFLDYATNHRAEVELPDFRLPPAPLPASETEGLPELEVQSNIFGNLPPILLGYVERKKLQDELETRLLDQNHTIITLHGRGGIGKTSLALFIAHKLAQLEPPPFDSIVWFSSRDLELRPTGPIPVRTAVPDLRSICKAYGTLFDEGTTQDAFAQVLHKPQPDGKGRLFIFDNFETLRDARGVHQFLDTHTHLPNKVLITSRERAFKADYPIEVSGMEWGEAAEMLKGTARELSVEPIVTENVCRSIFEYTEGHPYVMRVLVGEIAKEKKYVPAQMQIPKRLDIVQAVFERSFNKLSDAGRWIFLVVANWKSPVWELALLVVCGQRSIAIEDGLEECTRLSLLATNYSADGQPYYLAPVLARLFAKKKLDSDPDRLLIQEDIQLIQRFGALKPGRAADSTQQDSVNRFAVWATQEVKGKPLEEVQRLDAVLEAVAELWPTAWIHVVDFRNAAGSPRAHIESALRRLVEERPFDKAAWLRRHKYAKSVHDEQTALASLLSAVDCDPTDVTWLNEAADQLLKFVDAHKTEIPTTRRGVYIAGLRTHMEAIADRLDSIGLGRLAWLFLLENQKDKAREYAQRGYDKDPDNDHCLKLLTRLSKNI